MHLSIDLMTPMNLKNYCLIPKKVGQIFEDKKSIIYYKENKMVSILPPPKREDYDNKKDYETALKEWEKAFESAKKYMFRRNNDDIELIGLNSPQYTFRTTNKTLKWGDIIYRNILDRKTLVLKFIKRTKVVSNYKCEVTDGKEDFIIQMKKIKYIYQSKLKEKLKKLENKI